MAPEHDARTRAFYDHESDDPSPRRRRAAADWGVNEDIFDRMPSRRFRRPRADHHDESDAHRFERRVSGPARPAEAWADGSPRGEDAWADEPIPQRRDDWTDEYERRQIAPRRGDSPQRDDERRADEQAAQRRDETAPRDAPSAPRRRRRRRAARRASSPPRAETRAARRARSRRRCVARPASSRRRPPRDGAFPRSAATMRRETSESPPRAGGARPSRGPSPTTMCRSRTASARSTRGWRRTPTRNSRWRPGRAGPSCSRPRRRRTLEPAESLLDEPPVRRTVTITGHPDRLPAPRAQRPPKTALEHIGTRPDRIVGYAVLLGFVLVLIAVLTTGQ